MKSWSIYSFQNFNLSSFCFWVSSCFYNGILWVYPFFFRYLSIVRLFRNSLSLLILSTFLISSKLRRSSSLFKFSIFKPISFAIIDFLSLPFLNWSFFHWIIYNDYKLFLALAQEYLYLMTSAADIPAS